MSEQNFPSLRASLLDSASPNQNTLFAKYRMYQEFVPHERINNHVKSKLSELNLHADAEECIVRP